MVVSLYMISADTEPQARELSYMGEFRPMVVSGQVASVEVRPQGNDTTIYTGKLKNGSEFYTQGPADEGISEFFEENGVTDVHYNGVPEPNFWTQLLLSLLPILLIGAFLFFMLNQGQGGGKVMQFGKSRARLHLDEKKRTTFKDVAGIDEVIEELSEVVDFLKTPKKYNQLGARIPKGVLLYGSPGTGKTLLAKAVAGEAGVPFFTISGSDFVEMFVGVGASRVRDLFDTAKKHAPCIIFIDEIDAVGRQRGSGVGGGHDEREQTLNQLLVEMDGFSANEGIIVLAGTNRPDILDPALLRPGRFDRQIAVGAPDIKGREAILRVHAQGKQIADDVDMKVIAKRTPGFTGADLANLLNEAALLAARRNKVKVEMVEVEEAVERVIAGPEKKSHAINPREKKLVSYHEAGHAVTNYYLENTDPVHKVSIIPRGMAGGYTLMLPEEDVNYQTKTRMLEQVVVMLGGRVAEQLVLGDISTGA
ncbi:MAG: ATP-dependent zinc metalloprotease FtsH, partial [Firmicutes bacterium]|nr:ATP-dependent zinc metalloprotease FtsH [Bacillota bacterium]